MSVLIELKDVSFWQKSISAISSFISEGNFRFNEKGIGLKAMDSSQIVLVNYLADKKAFDRFDIEPTFVGVDLIELHKIVSRGMPGDRMMLDINETDLVLRLEGELNRSFELPLIDVSDDDINLPEIKYEARIEINARILKEALKDAALFGTAVVLKAKGNQFFLEAKGTRGNLKTIADQQKKISVKTTKEVVSKYSLNFLSNIVKEAEPEKSVVLELKSDAPMKISYNIGPANIQFHLAHMIL